MEIKSVIPFLIVFLLTPLSLLAAPPQDMQHSVFNNKAVIFVPKYWEIYQWESTTIDNDATEGVYIQSQSELSSRLTKYVYFEKSNKSGVFILPPPVAAKLSEKDLVNFYIHSNLKNSINGRLLSAGQTTVNGESAYNVKWSYLSPGGLNFGVDDYFFFKNPDVYQLQGQYVLNLGTDVKSLIDSIISSVSFN